jgi:hypothetical protein
LRGYRAWNKNTMDDNYCIYNGSKACSIESG